MSILAIRLPEMIGLTILHSLWQITLLWIILIIVLRLFPKVSSALRYTFSISILMLAVLTTTATAVYEWQLHSTSEEIAVFPNGTAQTVDIVYIPATQTFLSKITEALNATVPILAWLWCAGLVVMGTRFGGSFFYLRTLRAQENITAIPSVWKLELKRLSIALGLNGEVSIATSARISSPITLGSISPIILVPAGLLSGMSTAQIEAILVHELYHIKRSDYLINICQALVEVLLFYHPAIWHINTIIREERENCCDDQTLAFCGDAITYARALTQILENNTFTKPTLAMSATGPNAGHFSNRIKRLFNIYPNPAQDRSKGIFAIGFLLVYLSIVLTSANVLTAHPVGPEKENMKPRANFYNTFSNIFTDSIPNNHRYVIDRKEFTPQPMVEKIHSMEIPPPDTTVHEQSLANCIQQFRLLVKMAALYRLPGDSLRFSKFSVADSANITLEPQSTGFYGPMKPYRSRTTKLHSKNSIGSGTTKDEETEDRDVFEARFKIPTTKEIPLPWYGVSRGSIRIFASGVRLQEGPDYTVDYTLGKVIITHQGILTGESLGVQYMSDPFEFLPRSLAGAGVDYQLNENANEVHIFPNATKGQLNIRFTPPRNNARVKMVMIDPDGKAVKEITDSTYDNIPTELHVDTSGYKKGLYILLINIDGAKSQQRVIVE